MMFFSRCLSFILLVVLPQSSAFQISSHGRPIHLARLHMAEASKQAPSVDNNSNNYQPSLESLKDELTAYLAYREEVGADEAMKSEVGRIVGGTKGNKVLNFISGAPAAERAIDEAPNMFDYSELTKYGYSYLAKPIMEAGGRIEMYRLMGLTPPVVLRKTVAPARKLVIDRTGAQDEGRYQGLKMNTLVDDNRLGEALQQVEKKVSSGESLRTPILEELYEQPFADKRNTGPQQTPLWTPATLDEEGRKLGKAVDWARAAKAGAFVRDPAEIMAIDGSLRVYSVLTSFLMAVAFGHASTESFLKLVLPSDAADTVTAVSSSTSDVLVPVAVAIVVANIGASIFSYSQAPAKNRNKVVWGLKGLLGGPLAIAQLRGLGILVTRAEQDEADNASGGGV